MNLLKRIFIGFIFVLPIIIMYYIWQDTFVDDSQLAYICGSTGGIIAGCFYSSIMGTINDKKNTTR